MNGAQALAIEMHDVLRLAGLFACPYARPAPASQARGPDSPYGLSSVGTSMSQSRERLQRRLRGRRLVESPRCDIGTRGPFRVYPGRCITRLPTLQLKRGVLPRRAAGNRPEFLVGVPMMRYKRARGVSVVKKAGLQWFGASGQRPVIGPKASSPLMTLTTL
jgi:hypothetical protein